MFWLIYSWQVVELSEDNRNLIFDPVQGGLQGPVYGKEKALHCYTVCISYLIWIHHAVV